MTGQGGSTRAGRRRRVRSSGWVALTALACAVLVACGDDAGARDAGASKLEPTTSRGLAAEILPHVDPKTVDFVGGSDQGKDGWVASVETNHSDVSTILVEVRPIVSGQRQACDDEAGIVIECEVGPPYVKLVAHGWDDLPRLPEAEAGTGVDELPVLEGWFVDRNRGSVMVLLYGKDTQRSRHLAMDLLNDRLLGEQTSAAMNRAGRHIAGFDELTFETRVDAKLQDPLPTNADTSSSQR